MASGARADLELLRQVLADDSVHITIAQVTRVTPSSDNTSVTVEVTSIIDQRELACQLTFDSVGAATASGDLPDPEDLCLVAFAESDHNQAYVLKYIPSIDEPLPPQIAQGHMVHKSKPGKKLYVASDTKVEISRGTAEATEPLVLGNVLLSYLTALEGHVKALIDALNSIPATISTAPGTPGILNPALTAALTPIETALEADKGTYLTTPATNVVSQIGFTERGV
jgi:hypothetical protein